MLEHGALVVLRVGEVGQHPHPDGAAFGVEDGGGHPYEGGEEALMANQRDAQFGNAAEVQQYLGDVEDGDVGVLHVARFASLKKSEEHRDNGAPDLLERRPHNISGGPEDHFQRRADHAYLVVVIGHGQVEGEGVGGTVLELGVVLGFVPVIEFGTGVGDGGYSSVVADRLIEFCIAGESRNGGGEEVRK